MELTVETITPAEAAQYLERNINNRPIKRPVLARYVADMQAGAWRLSGEPVRFNENGDLIDGQHRLQASIDADASFTTVVARGVEDTAMPVLDTGKPRSLADVLHWMGEASGTTLAGTIRFGWRYDNDMVMKMFVNPSFSQLLDWFKANPDVRDSVRYGKTVNNKWLRVPATVIAGVHYLMRRDVSEPDATAFFDQLVRGIDLDEGSPLYAYRRFIERSRGERDKPRQQVYAALLIKAANAWLEGIEVSQLRWRAGGANREEFPRLSADSVYGP